MSEGLPFVDVARTVLPETAAALQAATEALEEIKALPGRASDADAAWGIANEVLKQLAVPAAILAQRDCKVRQEAVDLIVTGLRCRGLEESAGAIQRFANSYWFSGKASDEPGLNPKEAAHG